MTTNPTSEETTMSETPETTTAPEAAADTTEAAPTWEGDFDPDKAARLVANLRRELADVKDKYKAEKARAAELESVVSTRDLADARTQALAKHNIPVHLAGYVTGNNAEEVDASAAKVAADFGAAQVSPLPSRPKPRLKPGHGGDEDGFDPRDLVRRLSPSA